MKDRFDEDECDISYEKCRRLEVLAKRAQREVKKKEKPIVKEKDIFENWKEKPKKKMTNSKKYSY